MRLDLFLKTTRLISSRNLAQEFCDSGLVKVNGSTAKSSKEIKAGDEIEIRRRNRVVVVSVLAVPEKQQVSKADAPGLYEIIREEGTESVID